MMNVPSRPRHCYRRSDGVSKSQRPVWMCLRSVTNLTVGVAGGWSGGGRGRASGACWGAEAIPTTVGTLAKQMNQLVCAVPA